MIPVSKTGAALAILFLSASGAVAQSCSDAVDRLAQQHNLLTSVPPTARMPEAPPATTESRGLTETQPAPGSNSAFTPPPRQTPPAISGSSAPPPADSDITAADRGRMEALLKAARDADQRGDRTHCIEHLREAEAVQPRPK